MIAEEFDADLHGIAYSGRGIVRNFGDPNATAEHPFASYYPYVLDNFYGEKWNFSAYVPDLVIINLGANDYDSPPQASDKDFVQGYSSLISTVRQNYGAQTKIALMCIVENVIYLCDKVKEVSKKFDEDKNVVYLPVVPLGFNQTTDLGCDLHPSVTGHKKIADVLKPTIKLLMQWF